MDRDEYEHDLALRKLKHLEQINVQANRQWRPCMHDACPECVGTGLKLNGQPCVHGISCPCPKCSPYSMSV